MDGVTEPLYETNFLEYQRLVVALISLYGELGDLDAEIAAEEELLSHRPAKDHIPAQAHGLASLLVQRGKGDDLTRAKEMELASLSWFDEHPKLGKGSPQALSVRRVLIAAYWRLREMEKAKMLLREVRGLIKGGDEGRFGVYKEEEEKLVDDLVKELNLDEERVV